MTNTTPDKPMPKVIWALAYPWTEWAKTKKQAEHKSEVNCCGAKFTKYIRADLVKERVDEK